METLVKTKWGIDTAHSEIGFKVRHMVISSVSGRFEKFDATMHASEKDLVDAEVEFWADAGSVHTNNTDRDNHLRSAEFFDIANHPRITFRSTRIEKKGDKEFLLTGDLSIRGVTRSIDLNVELGGMTKDPWGKTRAGFEITGKLSRKDYGLTWNATTETGGLVVSDEVKIQINAEMIKNED